MATGIGYPRLAPEGSAGVVIDANGGAGTSFGFAFLFSPSPLEFTTGVEPLDGTFKQKSALAMHL